jgi:hypothetical protein
MAATKIEVMTAGCAQSGVVHGTSDVLPRAWSQGVVGRIAGRGLGLGRALDHCRGPGEEPDLAVHDDGLAGAQALGHHVELAAAPGDLDRAHARLLLGVQHPDVGALGTLAGGLEGDDHRTLVHGQAQPDPDVVAGPEAQARLSKVPCIQMVPVA